LAAPNPSPPDPQPCKNPQTTSDLVPNYITDKDGTALPNLKWDGNNALEVLGSPGQQVDLPKINYSFTIDFSKLQSLFANTNSNYLEGEFQTSSHTTANINDLNSQDFNQYHGADQKTSPKSVIDPLKEKYIKYIYEHPNLPESANKYTDTDNQGDQKTIYDLVTEYGLPTAPEGTSNDNWLNTWGKYWEKIPTAWSEFYQGEIYFHYIIGKNGLKKLQQNGQCPPVTGDPIDFVMPEFFRTTAISDQLNRIVVPKEAQSYQDHGVIEPNQNPISFTIEKCWELIRDSATNLKKAVKISLKFANPVKTANAADDLSQSCIKPITGGKEGDAPYCPLPQYEASKPGVSCTNKDDSNKLEKNNPNVVCTFIRSLNGYVTIDPNSVGNDGIFDSCEPRQGGRYLCKLSLQIYPDIQIPWIAAIWNNTLYSQEDPSLLNQKTGRPGIFGLFTPKAVEEEKGGLNQQEILDMCLAKNGDDPLCQALGGLFTSCVLLGDKNRDCVGEAFKQLAGSTKDSQGSDPKERFVGGVDCGKNFVRDVALKPIALQQELNIKQNCNIEAAAATQGSPQPTSYPANTCGGKYLPTGEYPTKYFNETGNFGDPSCDYSESKLYSTLRQFDPANADFWFYRVVSCESGFNPNNMRHHHEAGQADTPDPAGAWGLFQMGIGNNPTNGPLDNGRVPWWLANQSLSQQVKNAVNYKNQRLHGSFDYWACAGT
ncbi:MAG TPA: hypothetical protein VLE91_04100, partial [Candidatus Saccharimonadales bacterium]|nr:hypothetical protein [Candidatus Saccharimonadales bacterium]